MRKYLIISICIIIGVFLWTTKEKNFDIKQQHNVEDIPVKDDIGGIKEKENVLDEIELSKEDKAQIIFNNGNVELCLNGERLVLDSDITESMLFDNNGMPNTEFKLHKINGTNYIGVKKCFPTMRTIETHEEIFGINNNKIYRLWSSNEIASKLLYIKNNEVIIDCYSGTQPITLKLTEEESNSVIDKIELLKENGIKIDESFWKSIQDNLLSEVTDCNWIDIDQDGDDEMILSIYYYTVGAMTPISLKERGIIIFEVGDSVHLSKVIFEKDNKDDKLKKYFVGER